MATSLARSAPGEEGVDPAAILGLVNALESAGLENHSLMIVRYGKVIAEGWWSPYRSGDVHRLYSLTKSFLSTAVGFAVAEGFFALDDRIVEFFPGQLPGIVSPNLAAMKVRHLLTMSTGHEAEPTIDVDDGWEDCARRFFTYPVPREPGSYFVYNTAASNMLAIVLKKTTGLTLDSFLRPRLLEPLGIDGERWSSGKDFVWGGSGLFATTETIAKFGLLYLNKGKWEGRQILPEGWVELATECQVQNGDDPLSDWAQGYCFQFWRCRHDCYRGDGAFGQFCVVIPEFDAVVAITSGEDNDNQPILNAIWENLLPGFDRPPSSVDLDARLNTLTLAPRNSSVLGLAEGTFSNAAEKFSIDLRPGGGTLNWGSAVEFATDKWIDQPFYFGRNESKRASARAIWISNHELQVKIVELNSPQSFHFHFQFGENEVSVKMTEMSVFGVIPPNAIKATVVHPVS